MYLIFQHYFEFEYVWKYSNKSMPPVYLLASFWSGQQGSFLLWIIWTALIILIIQQKHIKLKSEVLIILLFVQVWLLSMLLGVYLGNVKIGYSPFTLIRELPENVILPWASLNDYLQKIEAFQDGNGLNPLLQNYWMAIHPPALFAGFALCSAPFSFALAGAWRKSKDWPKPCLPWTVLAVTVLGIGILMGGAWAYEALSFGGFWAWDPVENASLVPWIVLLAALHMMIVHRKKGQYRLLTLLLSAMAFLLALYSTFLTRSGVLGESSVHSFTDNGLMVQLFLFLITLEYLAVHLMINAGLKKAKALVLIIISVAFLLATPLNIIVLAYFLSDIVLLLISASLSKTGRHEEAFWSREFWIFLATLVLVLSAIQISISTSIPVINKLIGTNMDAFTNLDLRNAFYKTWQLPLATALLLLLTGSLWLSFGNTNTSKFLKKYLLAILAGGFLALTLILIMGNIAEYDWSEIIFATIAGAAISGNFLFLWQKKKSGALKKVGAPIAHAGFGLIMLGAVLSTGGSFSISENTEGFDVAMLDEKFKNNENIILEKERKIPMERFKVTYLGKKQRGVNIFYQINYLDTVNQKQFKLEPFVQLNERFGNVPEPDTRHFWNYDLFTHVKWADLETNDQDDFMNESLRKLKVGSAVQHENIEVELKNIYLTDKSDIQTAKNIFGNVVVADVVVTEHQLQGGTNIHSFELLYSFDEQGRVKAPEKLVQDLGTKFRINRILQEKGSVEIGIREKEYLVMSAEVFPYINILWIGCVVMALGGFVSFYERKYRAWA
ncbi:MAG TPA: hypothetical protein DDY13_09635 [Cytophagales bacterium]|jgi:cytochrome c-type biogenesis protein CcmF|nr:hypothetical protein [Cytophagales bacterium]